MASRTGAYLSYAIAPKDNMDHDLQFAQRSLYSHETL